MEYNCNFCNGTGKQSGGLGCVVCKRTGFFNAPEETTQCPSCKGTGKAAIRTLPCISCGGRGVVLFEVKELQELQKPEAHIVERTKNLVNEAERVMEDPMIEKTKNLLNEKERAFIENIICDIGAMRQTISRIKSIVNSIEKRLAELSDPAS